jgi:hypothetical protein
MATLCPVTGGKECFCEEKAATKLGSALLVDAKAALRNLFNDHLDYTFLAIIKTVPVVHDSQSVFLDRLLKNPGDMSEFLKPIIGAKISELVGDAFTKHLQKAAAVLVALNSGDQKKLDVAIDEFYAQGKNQLAAVLSSIRPNKLSLKYATELVSMHNEFVVELAVLQQEEKWEDQTHVLDRYRHHGLKFSDALYETLTS